MTPERVAIIWGGGLGDVLVIRPLLEAACQPGWPAPLYMTRVHEGLDPLSAMGLPIPLLRLPAAPIAALRAVRRAGHFDRVYWGPHNTWRSRWLGRAVAADRSGPFHRAREPRFLADAIARDVVQMGWAETPPPSYGSLPLFPAPVDGIDREPSAEPYLVAHPGCKIGWQTTAWPFTEWRILLKTLAGVGWRIRLVGSPNEYEGLNALAQSLSIPHRMSVHTEWPLWQLERVIARATGIICHNSGIMHLALAYRRRTIVLTGSSAPYWRASYEWVRNLSSGDCNLACNRYRCPVPGYHARCIRNLEVRSVLTACQEHWGEAPG